MSPRFYATSLNLHLPSRIGSALLLVSMLLYVVAMLVPMLAGAEGLDAHHWPDTLAGMLVLSVCGVPAVQYTLRGEIGRLV